MAKNYDNAIPDPTKCPHGNVPGECFYCGDLDAQTTHGTELGPQDAADVTLPDVMEGERAAVTVGAATEKNETKGPNNEDAVLEDARSRTYGVLDGMGGHAAGEVASRQAAKFIMEEMARMPEGIRRDAAQGADYIRSAVVQASGNLRLMADADPNLEHTGTMASHDHLW